MVDHDMDATVLGDTGQSGVTAREGARTRRMGEALDKAIKRIQRIKSRDSDDSLPDHFYKIELRSLKRKRAASMEYLETPEQPPSKRMRSKLTRCCCELRIFGKGLHDDSMNLIIQDRQFCNLSRVLGGDGDTLAEIDLAEKAFFVKADRLFKEAERGSRRMQTLLNRYTIEISFTTTGSPGWPPEPLKSEFGLSGADLRHPIRLSSTFDYLPHCPKERILLDVEGSSTGGPSVKSTEAALEIMMTWSKPPPQKLRGSLVQKQNFDIEQDPTQRVKVRYFIGPAHHEDGNIKKKKVTGYGCLFCDGREFRTIELLHFHLITCHENFKYKVNTRRSHENRTKWEIHLDIADYRGFNDEDEDDVGLVWVRPKRPFVLSKFLRGDDSWITGRTPLPTPPPPSQLSRSTSSARNSQTRQVPGAPTVIDPNTIADLPKPKTKKFPIPPGGRYYRSLTKRRLKEGEWLSESDDDVDESWLIQKHKETLDDFADVFGAEKTFMKRFDEHMLRENLCAQRYVPGALIRFCRANRQWLNNVDMLVEFWKQSLYLAQHGIINSAHVKACMDIIQGTDEAGQPKARLGNCLPEAAGDPHMDLPLMKKAPKSGAHRRSARDSLDSEMDIDDDVGGNNRAEEEQIERDVRTIIHGDEQLSPAQQISIRTVQHQQQPVRSLAPLNKDSGYAAGEYVNTSLCYGDCGERKGSSDLIICGDPVSYRLNPLFTTPGYSLGCYLYLISDVRQAFLASVLSSPSKTHPELALSCLFIKNKDSHGCAAVANTHISSLSLFYAVLEDIAITAR
ncbi:hypothetical protein FGG08_003009 [Glutinoglossum americanum]|uniref:Polycomb protein VEFS-Box domain-containing protein n=1 Tax=Glutinoglossum americanum TaxID=1670608 RepID=A0A9P8L3Z9_9PEZI|nr:hypothetical protein FGG08_003009 [Glutinoglossum americanum]